MRRAAVLVPRDPHPLARLAEVDWRQFDLLGFLGGLGFEPAPRLSLERKVGM